MKQQFYRDDLVVAHKFYNKNGDAQEQIPVPKHVRLCFFTAPEAGVIRVERNGDICDGCSVTADGMILSASVSLSRTCIGKGPLMCLVQEFKDDPAFPQGVMINSMPVMLDVVLGDIKSDDAGEISSDVTFGELARILGDVEALNTKVEQQDGSIFDLYDRINELDAMANNAVDLNTEQTIIASKKFTVASVMQGGLSMAGTRIRKLATPLNSDDAANKQYVDDATGNIVNIEANVASLQTAVNAKADVVDISNYLTEGAVLPYPAAYRYALNVPHMLSFRKYGAPGTPEEWYIVFCSTHIYPSGYNGYEYIFFKRDENDGDKYKFFKRVNHGDHSDDEWYKLGAKVFGEDLRESKQDKLTDEQIANIAAVPNKVDLVEISSINNEGSAGTRFPFPAMYSYYGGTLPHAAQFSLNEGEGSVSYIVLCLWHTTGGYPAAGQYALFRRSDSDIRPAYIEFLRYVGPNDEWYNICQAQFHDDLPAKVTALQAEVAALKAIINEITTKE